ncbi:S8 family serine peptidase [Marinactinospora rubrisoli]|uniref:S8 family serine peptidase n=1 Tax=Marinactinospora rubrisoli TaxID=2715399 RepID=A0ABW2K8Z6_9ACTN
MHTRTPGTSVALGSCAAIGGLGLLGLLAPPVLADTAQQDLRAEQWSLEAIGAAEAWERTEGAGVTVAVLNTGVDDTHPDLSDKVEIGGDYTGQDLAPGDEYYGANGTMLAGIIAANGHGQEHTGGIMGVAPAAEILSVRVTPEADDPAAGAATARADAVAQGVRHAVNQGVQVIALPAGDGGPASEAEQQAISYAVRHGVVVVAPGGDGGSTEPEYPGGYEGVLAVGAVDETRQLAATSSRQENIAVTAPGAAVPTIAAGGGYTEADGTAAAAAFAAGTAALVRAEFPQLRPQQVTEAIVSGAQSVGGAQGQPGHGAGLLNAPGALAAAEGVAEDVPPFDPDLAEDDGGLPIPAWTLWAGGGVLVLALLVAGVLVLRRQMANPYGLPPREEVPVPESEAPRRGAHRAARSRK